MAEFVENPMEPLQTIVDEISPRAMRRLTEAPRLADLTGFGQFLQNLRNQGMQPVLMGDFPAGDDPRASTHAAQPPLSGEVSACNSTSFVIFAEMRTGSNFLESNLNALQGVTCHGEAFNPYFIGGEGKQELFGIDMAGAQCRPVAVAAGDAGDRPRACPGFAISPTMTRGCSIW